MIIMSACLAGIPCRWDGQDKKTEKCWRRALRGDVLLVCPEVEGGLCIPRPPVEIPGGQGEDVLAGKCRLISRAGEDVTQAFLAGAYRVLELCRQHGVTEAWLKAKSPTCGYGQCYDGSFSGRLVEGKGVLAALLEQNGVRVICVDEE